MIHITNLPDGEYRGKWVGHDLRLDCGEYFKTTIGLRTTGPRVFVYVAGGEFDEESITFANEGYCE